MPQETKSVPFLPSHSKFLELLGGGILLLSFITQNFFYDSWNQRDIELHSAIVDQAIIDKSVLLNEALYFLTQLGDSLLTPNDLADVRLQKIHEAARKVAFSQSIPVLLGNSSRIEKAQLVDQLMQKAGLVKDYYSFSDYLRFVNDFANKYLPLAKLAEGLSTKRETARWIYLILYVLGSVILLIGIRYRK